jgi:hypothetical protein
MDWATFWAIFFHILVLSPFFFSRHTACPTGQTRHGDSCYFEASASAGDILTNADTCLDMGAFLWFPETSLEMVFVATNFPTPSNLYHLGSIFQNFFLAENFSDKMQDKPKWEKCHKKVARFFMARHTKRGKKLTKMP